MRPLYLIGGGGHCHSCIDVIETTNHYRIEGLVLPKQSSGEFILGYPVVGSDDDLPQLLKSVKSVLISVGQIKTPQVRIRLFDLLKQLDAELPVVISPRAYCSKHSEIGEGSIVMHGAIVNVGAKVGSNCIVNSQALIEHEVKIDNHCHISTGSRINGGVTIGKGSFVGSGAVIKEGVRLGENVIVGAGQIVLRDLPNNTVVKNAN